MWITNFRLYFRLGTIKRFMQRYDNVVFLFVW